MKAFMSSVCKVGIHLFHGFVRQRIDAELLAGGVDVFRCSPQEGGMDLTEATRPAEKGSVSRSMARGFAYAPSLDSSSEHLPVAGGF